MSTLTDAIERGESALDAVDGLYTETHDLKRRLLLCQASIDMGAALAALRQLQALDVDDAPKQEALPL